VGPGVRMRTLTPNRKPTAVPKAPVTTDIHETLDVHGYFGPESTLDLEAALDLPPEEIDLVVTQILGTAIGTHSTGLNNLPGPGVPYPKNVGQGHLDPLSSRKINTCNTCHQIVSVVLETRMRLFVTQRRA